MVASPQVSQFRQIRPTPANGEAIDTNVPVHLDRMRRNWFNARNFAWRLNSVAGRKRLEQTMLTLPALGRDL